MHTNRLFVSLSSLTLVALWFPVACQSSAPAEQPDDSSTIDQDAETTDLDSDIPDQDAATAKSCWATALVPDASMGIQGHLDLLRSVDIRSNGLVAAAGYVRGSATLGADPILASPDGLVLAMLDSCGTTMWTNTFTTDTSTDVVGADSNPSVSLFADSFIALVATSCNPIDMGTGPVGEQLSCYSPRGQVLVAKYDMDGNAVWARAFGDGTFEHSGVVALDDGHLMVAGRFNGTLSFAGEVHQVDPSADSSFAVAYDADGEPSWVQVWPAVPNPKVAATLGVARGAQDTVLLAGGEEDSQQPDSGISSALVVRQIEGNGTLVHRYDLHAESGLVYATMVTSGPNESVYVLGSLDGALTSAGVHLEDLHQFVVQFRSDGSVQRLIPVGESFPPVDPETSGPYCQGTVISTLTAGAAGDFYLAGRFCDTVHLVDGPEGEMTASKHWDVFDENYDMFVAHFAEDGTLRSKHVFS